MNESQALEKAIEILNQPATRETAKNLLALEPYINADKFGDLWEAFIVISPIELIMELDDWRQNQTDS